MREAPSPSPSPSLPEEAPWHPLPPRALGVHMAGELATTVGVLTPFTVLAFLLGVGVGKSPVLGAWSALAIVLVGGMGGLVISHRRFRRIRWRLDELGISLRHGRLWQHETQVPLTRVQHLDLTRGPLQQAKRLATLVVYTAGSRHGAVRLSNLDAEDAERLRDRLGRQLDRDVT